MKKIFLFILFILLIISVPAILMKSNPELKISKTEFAHCYSYLINLNTFELINNKCNSKIKITWDISDCVDNKKNEQVLYENGKFNKSVIKKNRYHYGSNIFRIYLDGTQIKLFEQYKFNDWYFYNYKFEFNNTNVNLTITGP